MLQAFQRNQFLKPGRLGAPAPGDPMSGGGGGSIRRCGRAAASACCRESIRNAAMNTMDIELRIVPSRIEQVSSKIYVMGSGPPNLRIIVNFVFSCERFANLRGVVCG